MKRFLAAALCAAMLTGCISFGETRAAYQDLTPIEKLNFIDAQLLITELLFEDYASDSDAFNFRQYKATYLIITSFVRSQATLLSGSLTGPEYEARIADLNRRIEEARKRNATM